MTRDEALRLAADNLRVAQEYAHGTDQRLALVHACIALARELRESLPTEVEQEAAQMVAAIEGARP